MKAGKKKNSKDKLITIVIYKGLVDEVRGLPKGYKYQVIDFGGEKGD